jgi:cytosol alanyl aminopeptidase
MSMHFTMKRPALVSKMIRCSVLLSLACSAAFAASDPQPPAFRLPTFAAPQHYSVVLTVAPDQDTFTGSVDIDLTFKEASQVLWLNAEKLTVKDATITAGGQSSKATVIPQPKDLVGFSFDHPIGPGAAKLHVDYQGEISRKDMSGIFQVKDGDHWYVYSQFENIWARRAVPCFDEPGYKVPWQVTLNVPREDGAFSNTPVVSEADGPNGTRTVKFAETKPLPSYLVAITVGPMEVVDAGYTAARHLPIRIIVPRGRTAEAKYVASITPDIVNLLEKYFAIPYPYEKLDEVAIPFAGYAMEHPGLVTYGAGIFLFKPDATPVALQRLSASIIAHELAHQWFGDLVTTAWWNDIWLNEGFASWMANKIVNQYHPEWKANIGELNNYQGAMTTDELISARKVRQEILSDDDIANAFDNITYSKGSALLNMFETYMGPEKFREGVQRYLHKYAYANATSAQFLEAVSGDDPRIAQAFSTFLDQAGVPLVTAELKCDSGKPRLELAQRRFLPRGSQGAADPLWNIPFCVKYPNGGAEERQCTLLTSETATLDLSQAKSCPAWIYGNAGESGYYRTLYAGGMLGKIVKDDKALTLPERVGMIGDIASLTKGYMTIGDAMALMPKFAADPDGRVVSKTIGIVGNLDDFLVPESLLPKYRKYLSDLYQARADKLGWSSKPGESDDDRLLRPTLLRTVANRAEDAQLIAQARQLANAFLSDRKAVNPDMVGAVLSTAARHGDRAFFDRLHAEAKKETDENRQGTMISAMGQFPDPAILKDAFSTLLNGEVDPRVGIGVLFSAPAGSVANRQAYEFVKTNWDALLAKLPGTYGSFLPFVAAGFCSDQQRSEVQAFFVDRAAKVPGGPRNLQQTLEGISLCVANKQANQASVVDFLNKY